ncbi:hypothetical protein Y699_07538 [Aspergillus fumigatus Z5]|nr:hypothetical protein Y699_07538 [Aspergillus fumigatus Z5]
MLRPAPSAGGMLYFISVLFVFLSSVAAAEPGIFYNPPTGGPIHDYSENPVYVLGQTVQLRWATSLQLFSIVLWQNDNPNYEWIQNPRRHRLNKSGPAIRQSLLQYYQGGCNENDNFFLLNHYIDLIHFGVRVDRYNYDNANRPTDRIRCTYNVRFRFCNLSNLHSRYEFK